MMPNLLTSTPRMLKRAAAASTLAIVLAAGALVATPAQAATPAEGYRTQLQNNAANAPVLVASHLGAWRNSSENSLQSITDAITLGVQITELDIWKTKDGQLVVMHDADVSRMTNGTGAISSLTLAQVTALQLKQLRGGASAALTTAHVPSFNQALDVAKDKILINADKAWALREQVYQAAAAKGMQRQIVFKSSAPVAEVNAFLTAHPDALYCHVINDGNSGDAHAFVREPDCYEVIYDNNNDPQIQPAYIAGLKAVSRVWMNTLWKGLAGSFTDEASLRDVNLGWGGVVAKGANIIQTDTPAPLRHWIAGASPATYDLPAGSVRVSARNYNTGGEGVAYHDVEAANLGGNVFRGSEGVDICDQQGAHVACYIRAGEWIKYTVNIPATGRYAIRARVSTPYAPAGSFTLELPGTTTAPVAVRNTTQHQALLMQPVASNVQLSSGQNTFTFRVGGGFQNFNVDYFQFDKQ